MNCRGISRVAVNAFHFLRILFEVEEFPLVGVVVVDELVSVCSHAFVCGYVMFAAFVVVIVKALSPIGGRFAFHQRFEALALHVGWNREARGIEECRREIYVLRQCLCAFARFCNAGPFDDERHAEGLFVHPAFVVPAVLAEVEALIAAVDDYRVIGKVVRVEIVQQATNIVID